MTKAQVVGGVPFQTPTLSVSIFLSFCQDTSPFEFSQYYLFSIVARTNIVYGKVVLYKYKLI